MPARFRLPPPAARAATATAAWAAFRPRRGSRRGVCILRTQGWRRRPSRPVTGRVSQARAPRSGRAARYGCLSLPARESRRPRQAGCHAGKILAVSSDSRWAIVNRRPDPESDPPVTPVRGDGRPPHYAVSGATFRGTSSGRQTTFRPRMVTRTTTSSASSSSRYRETVAFDHGRYRLSVVW